jgi:hypothetical protein
MPERNPTLLAVLSTLLLPAVAAQVPASSRGIKGFWATQTRAPITVAARRPMHRLLTLYPLIPSLEFISQFYRHPRNL